MKPLGPLTIATSLLLAPAVDALAQPIGSIGAGSATYRCVDSAGRSTYTNVQEEMGGKKCTLVSREVSVVPVGPAPVPPPAPGARPPAGAQQPATANRIDPQV